jgi:hypothetical protein
MAWTASDVLPSGVFVRVAFEVSAPCGVPLALFIVGYVQIVPFMGAASVDARVLISLAAALSPVPALPERWQNP